MHTIIPADWGTFISNGTSAFRFKTTNTSSLFAGTSNAIRCVLGWSIKRNNGGGVLFGIGFTNLHCSHLCFRPGRSQDVRDGWSGSTLRYRNQSWQQSGFQPNGADRLATLTGASPLQVGSTWNRPFVPAATNKSTSPPPNRPDPFEFSVLVTAEKKGANFIGMKGASFLG